MPDLNDSVPFVPCAPAPGDAPPPVLAPIALPPGPESAVVPESPVAPLADDAPAGEVEFDIPPLDPILDPVGHRRARLEALGERIAELSSRIQAATYELLVLIREFDADIGWTGWNSASQWLSWRTGLAPGAAREHVRVAHALEKLPKLSDAMRRGKVSYSKVRAVTRVATPETEQTLLDVALSGTAAHVEQIVRGWRRVDRNAERSEEKLRQQRRSLRTWVAEDGMVVVKGRLTPEVGAAFRRALEAACDQAYARRGGATDAAIAELVADAGGDEVSHGGPDMAGNGTDGSVDGSAAAAGSGVADLAGDGVDEALMPDVEAAEEELAPTLAQRQADAMGVIAECALAGGLDKGTAGDRYQVVVHVDAAALEDEADVPAGTYESAKPAAELDDAEQDVPAGTSPPGSGAAAQSQTVLEEAGGIHVSAETARRLACDAAKVEMQHGQDGEILDVGRRTRTISPALRRALAARDGQCRFPGCQNRRTDAHHVQHWAGGGETVLDNLVLLCRRHHRAVHEGGFRITLDAAGEVEFLRPDGRPFPAAPPAPLWSGPPLAPTNERLDKDGIEIDAQTATPSWKGERLDVGWAVGLLWKPSSDGPTTDTKS